MKDQSKRTPSSKDSDEETVEVAAVFGDGVHKIDRPRVVPSSESAIGGVDHDERGRARWKWKADLIAPVDPNAQTYDYLKALDTSLEIERTVFAGSSPAWGWSRVFMGAI